MTEVSQGLLLILAAAVTLILVQHGWGGVKAKLSVVFLGKPRPDLIQ